MARYVPEEQSQAVSHNVYVNLFLRSLTSRNEDVKNEVCRVLRSNILCVQNNILNSESLIKHCLIPMMDSVTNLEYVSPTLLDGLIVLLDLVGEKTLSESEAYMEERNTKFCECILEHLQVWLTPSKILQSRFWPDKEIEVAASLLNLFHKLPKSDTYLEKIVNMTIRLESVMHQYRGFGVISSPFRRCLNRYLAKYPIKAVHFFVQGSNNSHGVSTRLYIPNYISLWRSLLSDEQLRDPVLQYLRSDMDILIKSALAVKYQYAQNSVGVTKEQMIQIGQRNAIVLELHLQSLWTVQVLAKSQANWLCHQGSLVEYMTMMWRSPRRQKQLFGDKMLSLRVQEETRYLVEVLTLYVCVLFLSHESITRITHFIPQEDHSNTAAHSIITSFTHSNTGTLTNVYFAIPTMY